MSVVTADVPTLWPMLRIKFMSPAAALVFSAERPTYPASVSGTNRNATGMYCHIRNQEADLFGRCIHADGKSDPTKRDDIARLEPCGEFAYHGQHDEYHKRAGRKHHPRLLCRVSHKGLQKLRHEYRGTE